MGGIDISECQSALGGGGDDISGSGGGLVLALSWLNLLTLFAEILDHFQIRMTLGICEVGELYKGSVATS